MAVQKIPLSVDPNQRIRTALEGADYFLRMVWNQREEKWYLDLQDEAAEVIVAGVKMVCNIDLLALVTDTRRPAGTLRMVDTLYNIDEETGGPEPRDPDLEGFGSRWVLLYTEAAE